MKRFFLFGCILFLLTGLASAQVVVDTVPPPVTDSLQLDSLTNLDSLLQLKAADTTRKNVFIDSSLTGPVQLFSFSGNQWQIVPWPAGFVHKTVAVTPALPANLRKITGKELLFYALVLIFLIFAILRRAFPKYFSDLFRLFFKTTLKQRQIREQLMQTPLPSLLLNGFFVASGAFYAAFLLQHYSINPVGSFWLMLLYCGMGLSLAYFVKFAGLKICGWLFNMEEAADSYIFIVFIVNKMIGILLLPFLLVLAFSVGNVYVAGLTLSWCLVGGLFVYRFILTYAAVRNQVKVNLFHFFLYLCAFEIAPLLLVYKALLIFFNQTA